MSGFFSVLIKVVGVIWAARDEYVEKVLTCLFVLGEFVYEELCFLINAVGALGH